MVAPDELIIRRFVVGSISSNCYIVYDPTSLDALVIDPGDDAYSIAETVRSEALHVRGIVDTHGHADHIADNTVLKQEFGCPIMVHSLDAPYLLDSDLNLSQFIGASGPISPPADHLLEDGEEIAVGRFTFKVIHTPGHTPGGICLYREGMLFSGDTLFAGSVGRTDFPGGSHEQLIESIRQRLLTLPDDTQVYPGHGPQTTIGAERQTNPWL